MKKIVIIGAGVAGMSAGIYGQLNGFETEIYEMRSNPGGECTGWDRGEYHFDGCIHWLVGSKPGTSLNRVWREVGALDDTIGIVNHDCFSRFEENGEALNTYRNVDRYEKHLLEISPEDEPLIREMCKAIRAFTKMEMPVDKPMDMYSRLDTVKMMLRMLPVMSYFKKYGAMTVKDFAEQFKHPLLRHAFQVYPNKLSSFVPLMIHSSINSGDSGLPMGGSKRFAGRMEQKYLSLGGKIYYRSPIDKIKIVDGKATGVILKDGTERLGDYIISAADGHFTLQNMLEGKYMDEKLETLYSDQKTYPTYATVQVSVGVACDLSHEPHWLYFKPSHQVNAGGVAHEWIALKHYCYDGSFAPQGKSVVTTFSLVADYDWWHEKHQDREAYKAEKERLASEVCAAIEERYPETRGKIEQIDVATPMTYARYCNAWRGAYMSWGPTPKSKIRYLSGKLKGLDNFCMTGQWSMFPGLNGAATTGKWAIQRICKELKYEFKTFPSPPASS
jgi:phytoene desaturase